MFAALSLFLPLKLSIYVSLLFRYLIGQYVTIHDDVISHMNISEIESIDGGAYTCMAINTVGTITHTARVNVYGKHFYFIIQGSIFHQTTTYSAVHYPQHFLESFIV
mgnify:CR=1 FL=1